MKTTLREIKSFDPCTSSWKNLLKGLETKDRGQEVSEFFNIIVSNVQDLVDDFKYVYKRREEKNE